jgi:hypothetical protein
MAEVDLDRLAAGYRHRPPSHAAVERARLVWSRLADAVTVPSHVPGVALNEYVDTYDD